MVDKELAAVRQGRLSKLETSRSVWVILLPWEFLPMTASPRYFAGVLQDDLEIYGKPTSLRELYSAVPTELQEEVEEAAAGTADVDLAILDGDLAGDGGVDSDNPDVTATGNPESNSACPEGM